jgi:hypothetical protein
MKAPTAESKQQFWERLDVANEWVRKEKEQVFNIIKNWWVLTQNDISWISKNMKPEQKQEFLSLLMETDVKIDGIDFNNEPKEWYTIWNTDISVNPIKQAGEKILQAKEYLKNNPQADPIMKTLLQWVINTLDQTWLLSMWWSANPVVNALEWYLPKTDNPVTQWLMWFAGNTTRGVWQVIEWWAWLVDKGIAGTQSLVEWWPMKQYQTRQTGVGEDVLDIGAGATQSLASIYAMPASLLIGAGIEALPPEWQKAVWETMIWLWDIIAKTPWLSQWMESLPPERRDEFKAELAGAAIGMLWGLKGKSNIVKNPKLFLQQNLNPVQLAKNFNENVIGIPSKALDTAVSTVGKMKIPEVNMPSMKVPKAVSNKVDMVIEQLEWVWKAKKEWIQNNPYSKEIYSKVIDDIDNGNAPQNYKDMQEPYTKKVVEELDTILDDVKSQKWEWGEAFNLLRQDQTPIDTTVEIKSMNDLLKWTDYSLKTFLNRVDKWNLLGTRKILDNTATISTLHDIRKWLDDLMLKAQANKDSWEFKILKDMRKIVDGKLKENPDRVKADEEWARISKDIQEIEEGITYREQRKKWQIRDNIDSIIENINNPAKAKLRERLLQYMPDIWERISAIRGIPEIAKAYTTIPQWVIGRTAGALWWVAIWSTGWIPWMILWWIAWMFADVWLSQLRRNAIKKAIAKQSPKALEKLWEIQKAIADGKKLRAEQVIELQNFTNNLKKSLPANDKELINKVSELPKVMKTSIIPVKEWELISQWYTQKLVSPKREITEINPTAWKTYTARDVLEEVRAKKAKSNVSSKIDTIKAKDNQNIATNKTEALKKELKWVQSDTLVSKSDGMEDIDKKKILKEYLDKHAKARSSYIEDVYKNYEWEDAKYYIKQWDNQYWKKATQARKELWINKTRSTKEETMTKKFFELEEKKGLVNTSKWSPKNTPYAYSFDAYKAIWDDARASKAFERANLSTKEIKDIYKSWKITKQDVQDIIYAKQQNAQSQYIYERGIKRTVDRGWKNENDIILSLENMITDNKPSIWDKLDSLKASKELQPLYEEARKYKSADEFVNRKRSTDKFWHRTDQKVKNNIIWIWKDLWVSIPKEVGLHIEENINFMAESIKNNLRELSNLNTFSRWTYSNSIYLLKRDIKLYKKYLDWKIPQTDKWILSDFEAITADELDRWREVRLRKIREEANRK